MAEIIGAFVLGFFGSAHCVGMCGVFAAGIGGIAQRSGRRGRMLTAYFVGKTSTYVLLGLLAGIIGATVGTALSSFQTALSIGVGVLLIVMGVALLGVGRSVWPGASLYGRLSTATARLMQRRGMLSTFYLGMLNGLLPCGLVYAAMVVAGASGNVLTAMIAMAAFGLGTVPALALVGLGAGWLDRVGLRRYLPQAGAVLVIVMGILAIARTTPLPHMLFGHDDGESHQHQVDAPPHDAHMH